jgi:hypothetical protein
MGVPPLGCTMRWTRIGAEMPFSAGDPRSSVTNSPATSRSVASLITTVSGSAKPSSRAATLIVSPSASVSRLASPPTSPTTTGPVWMPTRA